MSRVFKCKRCTWLFEYPARENCYHCQSTDAVDRDTGETLRSVAEKDAKRNVNLASEEVKLELDPQYIAELDGLANAYIAGRLMDNSDHALFDRGYLPELIGNAYRFAYNAHEERAKALEHIRKGKQ